MALEHHLHADRWLAFLHNEIHDSTSAQVWLEQAAGLARRHWQARLFRLRGAEPDWQVLLDHCLDVLLSESHFDTLPAIDIGDAYNTWQRALGLYPITRWLAIPSIRRYHRQMSARLDEPAPAPRMQFVPLPAQEPPPAPSSLQDNALRLPLPKEQDSELLLTHYAPVLQIVASDNNNLPGQLRMQDNTPEVDTASPVAYYWLSWTRFRGENLLQLNYQFWFTRRPKDGLIDIYAGELDSLIWRVTLKPDGDVLFYDSIHSCGCYHKLFPVDPSLTLAEISGDRPVVASRPAPDARHRQVALLVEPDTHYLLDARAAPPNTGAELPIASGPPRASYDMLHADQLRRLPDPQRGFSSLYDNRGLVPESRRPERWLLWPLGVPSAGAMRQPGQHATAFIGRRHFDDPRLAEELFE